MKIIKKISGREVIVSCSEPLSALAQDVLETIETVSATSAKPLDTVRIRFGWSLLTLVETLNGNLVVCEPDFDGDPLRQTRPTIDVTLSVLARQVAFLRRVSAPPFEVRFDQFTIVKRGALAAKRLLMTRQTVNEADDSGWYLAEEGDAAATTSPDDLIGVRVFALLQQRAGALPALALPPGFTVLLEQEQIFGVWDADGQARLGSSS